MKAAARSVHTVKNKCIEVCNKYECLMCHASCLWPFRHLCPYVYVPCVIIFCLQQRRIGWESKELELCGFSLWYIWKTSFIWYTLAHLVGFQFISANLCINQNIKWDTSRIQKMIQGFEGKRTTLLWSMIWWCSVCSWSPQIMGCFPWGHCSPPTSTHSQFGEGPACILLSNPCSPW